MISLVLVNFAMSSEVGYHRKVTAATINATGVRWIEGQSNFHGGLLGCDDLRFSPVCEYMCVCSELGRVKRLSQTLHLCFFCVLDDTFELN